MAFNDNFIATHDVHGLRYVYYKRLTRNGYGDIAAAARESLVTRIDVIGNAKAISQYFQGMCQSELSREKALLTTKFGVTAAENFDYTKEESGETLIHAFNKIFNTTKVFNRNLTLIKETNGQKQLITWFPSYFDKIWKEHGQDISDSIKLFIDNNLTMEEAVQMTLQNWIPRIVREALIYMFTQTKQESGIGEEQAEAYRELASALQDLNNATGNIFVQSFIENYNLDQIGNILIEQMSQNPNKDPSSFSYKDKINVHSKGGLASESLSTYVVGITAAALKNLHNVQVSATQVGGEGVKPDVIITVDIPITSVNNWIQQMGNSTDRSVRARNVEVAQQLERAASQFTEGFIIYSNAKNYSVNEDFSGRGGFSSGSDMSLENWEAMINKTALSGTDFIYSILQTLKGAIGENRTEEVSTMFSRAIAAALFDDFETIINEDPTSNAIHLLYLQGMYIPLSLYFHLLAEAFNDYDVELRSNVNSLVKVNISTPEILFPTTKSQRKWERDHPGESAWVYQANEAMAATKVGFHFMGRFKQIMSKVNILE